MSPVTARSSPADLGSAGRRGRTRRERPQRERQGAEDDPGERHQQPVPNAGGWSQPGSSADTGRSSSASWTCTTEITCATASIATARRAGHGSRHRTRSSTSPASIITPAVNGRL